MLELNSDLGTINSSIGPYKSVNDVRADETDFRKYNEG